MSQKICYGCMKTIEDGQTCRCGFDIKNYETEPHQLILGSVLHDRYVIGRVLGEGGFGITYIGYDNVLEIPVAIKEFFMSGYVNRNNTVSAAVSVSKGQNKTLFENYREKFLNEARALAKFKDEDGIVSVSDFFVENNTAYIVMDYLTGQTLKEYLRANNKLSWEETLKIFDPVLKSLVNVHRENIIHRDISPDNIMLTNKGKVKLLDFGAARDVTDENKSLSVVLKHGYAPPEQYQSHGNQGPWTDVYALSATIYKCLTGKTPVEAMDRMLGRELEPVCVITSDCSQSISDVIMKGLEVQSANRYQSMGELAEALKEAYNAQIQTQVSSDDTDATVLIVDEKPKKSNKSQALLSKENVILKESKSSYGKKKNKNADTVNASDDASKQIAKILKKKTFVFLAFVICIIICCYIMLSGQRVNSKHLSDSDEGVTNASMDAIDTSILEEENVEVEERKYVDIKSAKVGDIVKFGKYSWQVLDIEDSKALLITTNPVVNKLYNDTYESTTWENCTLRKWLNNRFYDEFSDEEKGLILTTHLENKSHFSYITDEVYYTEDRLFLLSEDEVNTYFSNDNERAIGTVWYIRTLDYYDKWASFVKSEGNVYTGGEEAYGAYGVRPAFWLNLDDIAKGKYQAQVEDINANFRQQQVKQGKVGDTILLCNYEWRILAKEEDKALLITTDSVCDKEYNDELKSITWEKCTLRQWLNNEFYDEFSNKEKELILTTHLENKRNPTHRTRGGSDTDDNLFLLSLDEVQIYFANINERNISQLWWLRSSGYNGKYAASVFNGGGVNERGNYVNHAYGVRPAFWMNLE